jgi:trk system potassium uptake protein
MREREYLKERYRALLGYIGSMVGIIGVLYLTPIGLILFYPQEWANSGAFLMISLPLIAIGTALFRAYFPKENINLAVSEAMVIVVIVWVIALVTSAIPFMFLAGLNFPQALFESVSGWTGTGLSVVNPEVMPYMILFHRSYIQVAGGAGFAIIALSAISSPIGAISTAEGRTDQLAPHVRQSAAIVLRMYFGYIGCGIIALKIAGMGWFDAVNHAFTAVGTGGFSTKLASIAHWNNPLIEWIIIVLMILGGTNFLIAYTVLRGKWRVVLRSGEPRTMFVIISVSVLMLMIVTTGSLYDLEKAFRSAMFEVVSALTSTGFATVDYRHWNEFGVAILALLMIVGGGVGSTSGGFKLLRVYILYKAVMWEVRKAFLPLHAVNEPAIWQGENRELLSDKQVRQVSTYVVLFLTVFVMGVAFMTAHGYSAIQSIFEVASAIGTAGMSIGITQATMPEALLYSQSLVMFLGRLEFFAVLIGVLKLFFDMKTIAMPSKKF